MKPWAERFYKSKKWQKCRAAFIAERTAIDGGLCQRCRERSGYIVHHKEPLTKDNINNPDVSLNFNNFEFVCHKCHNKIHGVKFCRQRKFYFDSEGQPIPPRKNF